MRTWDKLALLLAVVLDPNSLVSSCCPRLKGPSLDFSGGLPVPIRVVT